MNPKNIKKFIDRWIDHGYEKGEAQKFWIDLLETLGMKNVLQKIIFEEQINGKFIDAIIPSQNILIEQKSSGKNLDDAFDQAKFYDNELPYNKKSRWIICSDFQRIEIHDMNKPKNPPEIILLENLDREYYRLNFLIDNTDENIKRELELSIKAGEIVGKMYDALHKQYIDPNSDESLKSLNKLCVRLVFCLYAESAGIFGKHKIFRDYLNHFRGHNVRRALIDLFAVLNQKIEDREPYLDESLKKFPYVNGGLFEDDLIEIPNLTEEILNLLIENASGSFDWSGISPTIFGAVFESTLNPLTRRGGGMHYTSIENIHKVIDPLFLDDLRNEFKNCRGNKKKLLAFQKKLSELKFLDPACGSGNFLTESYLSLRRLENEILKELLGSQIKLGELDNPIKISISQFYGIEINDFAVTVAKTALWIAESQMIAETSEIIHRDIDFLPLKTSAKIQEGNALKMQWSEVDFVMGNPPFVGYTFQTPQQKIDLQSLGIKSKNIDYVAGWYFKAANFIKNTKIKCAFVSTNSICQGEQVAAIWKNLNVKINFAYRTFKWTSESNDMAQVHCVIIGFADFDAEKKIIFDSDQKIFAKNINAYLIDAANIFVEKRSKPLCEVPIMMKGNQPTDDGNLIIEADELDEFIKREPKAKKFIRQLIGAKEFINGLKRYCLWLVDAEPNELRKMPLVMKRIDAVKQFRLKSSKAATRKSAETPAIFQEIIQPNSDYLIIPRTSSENRKYIPIGFIKADIIVNNAVSIIPNANLYHFGILTSSVHMTWTKFVCGRLKSDYRYSGQLVYNNFIWSSPSSAQYHKIELTASKILEVIKNFPNATLADLYDDRTMPSELRKAHRENDLAVFEAYGFPKDINEYEIISRLIKKYNNARGGGGIPNKI
ncbi:MAG: class I SAM-dependent DNA methyltransferase [Selenomonadaceae bacterium]|nr:class I SAM-dependent DNA methyltransferase [Selenomonadaceae bacterium]